MLRVIFDTNIYGLLALEKEESEIRKRIKQDKGFLIYGFKEIRKELRNTPKESKLGRLSKRNYLLSLYDELTGGRYLKESIKINRLALKYYNVYRNLGGIHSWHKTNINMDFTIVACASLNKLDIVISDDNRTMLSKPALKAYKHIGIKEGCWVPNFWKYSDLKERYKF